MACVSGSNFVSLLPRSSRRILTVLRRASVHNDAIARSASALEPTVPPYFASLCCTYFRSVANNRGRVPPRLARQKKYLGESSKREKKMKKKSYTRKPS